MLKLIAIILLVYSVQVSTGQYVDRNTPFKIGNLPRSKQDYDKPGHYEIAISSDKKQLNQKDEFILDAYFTGYGEIKSSKVFVIASSDIFDTSSKFISSISLKNHQISWGSMKGNMTRLTIANFSGGLQFKNADSTTYASQYIDAGNEEQDIGLLTEYNLDNAPLTIRLKLKDDVEPGEYNVAFYYTYFNGQEWKGTTSVTNFRVNSFIQQHSDLVTFLTLVLGVIAIFPVLSSFYDFYQKQYKKARDKVKRRKIKKANPR